MAVANPELPTLTPAPMSATADGLTSYQKLVTVLLAMLQFAIVLDFMILSPLGAILMPSLQITPSQFGSVVSAYAFSAGAAGILAAGFADRFDRKRLLLFFLSGFILGTLCCAFANTFETLLLARMVTGLFGGVIGSISFAIVTDLFPLQMRGRVMGVIQTSFAASQVLGIPLGLFLATHWGWHVPFLLIVGIGLGMGAVIAWRLRPIDAHLHTQERTAVFQHLTETVANRRHLHAFATMALLSTGGFMLMPFSSAFSVNNLGISLETLPVVYMVTGLCSIMLGPMIGRLTDRIGQFTVFGFGSLLSIVMVLIYTNLGRTPLSVVIVINVILFISILSRIISASTMISAVPAPANRGSFMAVNSSLQQISGGLAAVLAGFIVREGENGAIQHFDTLGIVVVSAIGTTVLMMYSINKVITTKDPAPPKS